MLVAGILIAVAIIVLPILTFMFNSILQNKQQEHDVGLLNAQLEFQQQMRVQDRMEKLQAEQQKRRQHMSQVADLQGLVSQLADVFAHADAPPSPRRGQDWRDEKEIETEGAGAHGG